MVVFDTDGCTFTIETILEIYAVIVQGNNIRIHDNNEVVTVAVVKSLLETVVVMVDLSLNKTTWHMYHMYGLLVYNRYMISIYHR